ncbi:MAG: carbohydrate porin [Bacteriovoracaceae bacterium]|nr:carbohydrate porin [Bacteriovoracaceae bacterium]
MFALLLFIVSNLQNSWALQLPKAEFDFFYTLENHNNIQGGLKQTNVIAGLAIGEAHLNDLKILPWIHPTDLEVSFMGYHGQSPQQFVGDSQYTSNMDVGPKETLKIYELYFRQKLFRHLNWRLGVIDLSRSYGFLPSVSVFSNTSVGTSAEWGSSGPNGAPLYPFPSFGSDIHWRLGNGLFLMVAITSEFGGNKNNLRQMQTEPTLSADSHFSMYEFGQRTRSGKWSLAFWEYQRSAPDLTKDSHSHQSGYFAQWEETLLSHWHPFFRYGSTTDEDSLAIHSNILIGTTWDQPFGLTNDEIGLMMSRVEFSKYHLEDLDYPSKYETAYEVYFKKQINENLQTSLHGLFVRNPFGDREIPDAQIINARITIAL